MSAMKVWITYRRDDGKESGCYREAESIHAAMEKFEIDHPAWQIISDARDNLVPWIIEILRENEMELSDGYAYYCGNCRVKGVLEGIAKEIASLLKVSP